VVVVVAAAAATSVFPMKEEHQDTVTAISLTKAQLITATLMSKAWELPSGCEFS